MSNDQDEASRERNLKQGGEAANLLKRLWDHEAGSLRTLSQKVSEEMGVSVEQVSRWANGKVAIPLDRRAQLSSSLRSHLWRVDLNWKIATAISEMSGINGDGFFEVDKHIVGKVSTPYKLVRFNGGGEISIGDVLISPQSDKPRWWNYSYTGTKEDGSETLRSFNGPVFKSGKSIFSILIGGTNGVEPYMRVEMLWPKSNTQNDVTYGVSLSTFIQRGTPLASPFALMSVSFWDAQYSGNNENRSKLEATLREKSKNGVILPVG